MTEAAPLSIEGLTLRYRRPDHSTLTVFEGLDLAVRPGEFLALIGESGCGKTSLLHALAGLLPIEAGSIDAARGELAMVFQKPQLLPWRNVLDNATYGAECRGRSRVELQPRARKLLERVGLADHLLDHPHQLSEGMKQRVNLARALLTDPRVLLLDEPFAALDVRTRRRLQDDLIELWQERGFTVIFVSHSLEEVVYLAQRVVLLGDKPAGVRSIAELALPYPRAGDPEANLALWAQVEALEALMRR